MTGSDDPLEQALHDLPTAPARPVESIEQRAQSITRRRWAGGAAIAAFAVAAAGLPVAVDLGGDQDPERATTSPTTQPCGPLPEGRAQALSIEEVPDEVRLLWSSSVAPGPAAAEASDFSALAEQSPNACPTHAHLRLVEVDDDVVTRVLTITALPTSEPIGEPGSLSGSEGSVAWWKGDEATWQVEVRGALTDSDVAELEAAVELRDGAIRVDGWSGAPGVHRVDVEELTLAEEVGRSFRARGDGFQLVVEESTPDDVWYRATVGARVVAVNGHPALLSTSDRGGTTVTWSPGAGVVATLRSTDVEIEEDTLLEIATSVRPVAADDERLVEAWSGRGS